MLIELQSADDRRDVVHRAVQALSEGKLVAFPTETLYCVAASALSEPAVAALAQVAGPEQAPYPLVVKSADEALDYVPNMGHLGQRLARRCWPGPVTLVFDATHPESLVRRLPQCAQDLIVPGGTLALRVPAHEVIHEVLQLLVGPVVLVGAHRNGDPDSTTAQAVANSLGNEVPLILDDGQCRFAQPASVVKIDDGHYSILRQGVVSEQNLKRLSSKIVVFVCTGNTCRSPMAEVLFQKLLADKLGCSIEELDEKGIIVMSAGLMASMGGRASPEGVEVMQQKGLDLSGHTSQQLSPQMIHQADLLLVMTRTHRDAILAECPEAGDRVHLICRDGSDVSDPIGGPLEFYSRCAQQIEENLGPWVDEVLEG